MSELQELQRRIATAVMQPLTQNETMRTRRSDGVSNRTEASLLVKPNDRLTAFERLEIYNRQYWFRLYSSFEEDFPGLKATLGRKRFEKLMTAYLSDCPSVSFTLRNLGSQLQGWLHSHPEMIEPDKDLALSMVAIEWAHIETFDAAEEPVLSPEELARINEDTPLRLQPYLRVLKLSHPVDDLLIAIRSQTGSQDAASNNASATRKKSSVRNISTLEPEDIYLAVHRQENSVYYKRLGREEYLLLQALLSGKTLGEALEMAMQEASLSEQEIGAFLQETFSTWAMLGWFAQSERKSQ